MGTRNSKSKNRSVSAQSFPTVQSKNFVGLQSKEITKDYILDRIIGKGSTGVVRLGTNIITGMKVAIKTEDIKKSSVRNKVFKEFQILRGLDHPNVMKVLGLYQNSTKNELLFVTEYIEGGSLFDAILSSSQVMGEQKIAKIVEEILDGLAYLHDNRVVHRDLKPENIMLVTKSEKESFVKIVDFGLAQFNHISLRAGAGTPLYMAPQIVSHRSYNEKVDIWSLGVMTYLLISGKPPFNGKDRDELFKNIRRGEVTFQGKIWEKVSPDCQDFISQCLRVDHQRRPSAQFLLNTPWIKKYAESDIMRYEEQKSLVNELKRFSVRA